METKKKEHLKLENNSALYFVMGMTLVLGLVYIALEWKSFDAYSNEYIGELNIPEAIEEIPPITIHNLPPPPPPPVAPTVLNIVPDDSDIIETPIKADDTDYTTEIVEATDIVIEEVEEDVTVILDLIDEVPVFPGCEDSKDKRACFQKMMTKHVNRNIRYPDVAIDLNIQGRVSTQFIIGKDGTIENVKMRGSHKVLEKEAARIIAKIPKMTPGKQKGKNAKVVFSLPINFKMQ